MLHPGRFDCAGKINPDEIAVGMAGFTPADIEYAFQQVAQFAFEQELATRKDYKVTTRTLLSVIPGIRRSLTDEIIDEFEKDSITYSRI